MDPNECLRLLIMATLRGDAAEAKEHRENLIDWLRKGGFEPDWGTHHELRRAVLHAADRKDTRAVTAERLTEFRRLACELRDDLNLIANLTPPNKELHDSHAFISDWLDTMPDTNDFQVLGEHLAAKRKQ